VTTFRQWLKGQCARTDALSALAWDAIVDPHFPEGQSRREIINYLRQAGASAAAMEAAAWAWEQFRRRRRLGLIP
jgi:hypothetical protein